MIKNKYYCLISGLPDILFEDSKSPFEMNAFRDELKASLESDDYKYIALYFFRYDNKNLLAYLQNENPEFDSLGNLSPEDLEDIISLLKDDVDVKDSRIPNHFRAFMDAWTKDEPIYPNMSWENQLASLYFNDLLTIENTFIRNWFEFELNVTNLLTAINCRKYELQIEEHIIGNNEMAKTIRNSNSKDFGVSLLIEEYDEINVISDETNIYLREQKLDLLKWKYLDENSFFHYFTIEKVFAFVVKLEILYRWVELSKEKGEELFRDMLNKLQSSYTLPEDFILKR